MNMIVKTIDRIKRINLHLHTNVSDGALSPKKLIDRAIDIKLDLLSITDHDTFEAYRHIDIKSLPLKILPGMEISSIHKGYDVHMLAYAYDMNNRELAEMTDMYLSGRRDRAVLMIEKLAELGMDISLDEVVAFAGARELIVRPHIAQAMVKRGYVANKNEAFDKYIGNNKPAFVHKPELLVGEVIKLIQNAGGFAVVAHPGKLAQPEFMEELIDLGIDGIEVWHPDHYQYQIEEFTQLALKKGLYLTGGSDFHGEQDNHNLFDNVPVKELVLDSVNKLWKEYQCRLN